MKYLIFFLALSFNSLAQNEAQQRRKMLDERYAIAELKKAIDEKNELTVIENKTHFAPLKDSIAAVNAAEKILFKSYSKKKIRSQKPYKIFLIDGYWVIFGSYNDKNPRNSFFIILEKMNGAVLKMLIRQLE